MKKTIAIIVGIIILVTFFGWGVFKFRVGVNDTSIGLEIGETASTSSGALNNFLPQITTLE